MPDEVWAVPSLPCPGRALGTRALSPLERTTPGPPGRARASPEVPGQPRCPSARPAAHLESRERPGRGGEGGDSPSKPRVRGAREEAEREAGWPRAGVRARAGAPERPASPPAPSLSPAPPQTHTHQAPTALRPRRPPPPCRAAGSPSERQLPGWRGSPSRLLPRGELSPARFFLFCPSSLSSGRRQGDGGPPGEWGEDR